MGREFPKLLDHWEKCVGRRSIDNRQSRRSAQLRKKDKETQ